MTKLVLLDVKVNVLVNVHVDDVLVRGSKNLLNLSLRESSTQMSSKLLEENGGTLLSSLSVANGVVDLDLVENSAVLESDLNGVTDVSLVGGMVLLGESLVLNTLHLLSEGIDSGVSGNLVSVVVGGESAVDERNGNHVLDAMVSVGVVVQRTLLVDDSHGGLLGSDLDLGNVIGSLSELLELLVEQHGRLASGLGVELSGERNLEENVLHDVRAVGSLELELLAAEEDVVESPGLGGQDRGHTSLTLLDEESQVNGSRGGITSSPRLSGHGVGGVSVGSQRLSVDKGLRDGVGGLLSREAEHAGDNGGGGDLDEHNVVETNSVERVLDGEATLDLVGLDHGLKDVLDLEDLALKAGLGGSSLPVGNGEDTSQVIGGMSPLGGEPAIVEIEPSDDGSDVEGTSDRVDLVVGTGDLGSVGHNGAGDNGANNVSTLLVLEALKTTAEGVEETESSGLHGDGGVDLVVMDVVGNVLDHLVGLGPGVVGHDGAHSGRDKSVRGNRSGGKGLSVDVVGSSEVGGRSESSHCVSWGGSSQLWLEGDNWELTKVYIYTREREGRGVRNGGRSPAFHFLLFPL